MPRQKNPNTSIRISISVTDQMRAHLDALARKGLHGATASEVAKYFVTNGVLEALRAGDLSLPEPNTASKEEAV